MKGIIVNQSSPEMFFRVWDADTVAEVETLLDFDRNVYTKEALLADPSISADADFLFSTWGMPVFTPEEVRALFPKLKAVLYGAGTVQTFARPFLEAGIQVFSAWAANGVPVAEFAVSQILLANKGYFQAQARERSFGRHDAMAYAQTFPGNYTGTTIGLIGIGMIGTMMAKRLHEACRDRVIAFDPFLSDERAAELHLEKVSLETLFSESQTISNHLANNPQTVGMLDYALFSRMKPNATFVNTGRGAQVVKADLIRALREEPDRTAVLDVTFPEPPEKDSPFYTLPNVFLTPHIAGSIGLEVARMGSYLLEELHALLENRPTRYSVTLKMLETMA